MEQLEQLENALAKLKNKESKFYFLTQDTVGNAAASVNTNYQYVKHLIDAGYNAYILHEKTDYKGVSSWLDEEYTKLPHANIEGGELKVGPQDFVIIPEVFGHVLEQLMNMPCTKIMLSQCYDYILETLNPGFGWANYNVNKCITTTQEQSEYIKKLFPSVETTIITPTIPEYFKDSEKPKRPVIGVHTRDQRETMKLIKSFYLQNPQFKWVTFKDLRGLSRKDFARDLGECCVSVWVDRISSYGTFPLESMMCKTPVIGVLPMMKPEWLNNENGIWAFDESKLVEVLGNYMKNWLEDSLPSSLYEKMDETVNSLPKTSERDGIVNYFDKLVSDKISELDISINKVKPVEENI